MRRASLIPILLIQIVLIFGFVSIVAADVSGSSQQPQLSASGIPNLPIPTGGGTGTASGGDKIPGFVFPGQPTPTVTTPPPTPAPVVTTPAPIIIMPTPTPEPVISVPISTPEPVVITTPASTTPSSRFGQRRYVVGSVPLNPPNGGIGGSSRTISSVSRTTTLGTSTATGLHPPASRFTRWSPVDRWRADGTRR